MRCFVFRLRGRYGHFRKFYTTASALSYDFPPPTTIRGLIGAITGCEDYLTATQGWKTGVVIERLEGKFFCGLNLRQLKKDRSGSEPFRTQANRQVLVSPSYRIYVCGEGRLFELFTELLQEGRSIYYTYLGKTSYPAFTEPLGFERAVFVENATLLSGVFPLDCVTDPVELLKQRAIYRDRVPVSFLPSRTRPVYMDVLYTLEDIPLEGNFRNLYRIGTDHVYLFSS